MRRFSILFLPLLGLPAGAAAQDVEMWGERYGTRPPVAYYEEIGRDVDAFEFTRGRSARLAAEFRARHRDEPGPLRILGPRSGPVTGTFTVPVVMGLFSDSPSPDSIGFSASDVAPVYFGSAPGTITDFYDEISGGRVELLGDLMDWTRATYTQAQATGGQSGLRRGTTGPFIKQLLERLDGVDWGLYDNDGPDGVPNSGDDDGFVDALAVLQPTQGGECGGDEGDNRIWSHRWSLRAAAGATFVTDVPAQAAGGGFIEIDDYTVQPIFSCNGQDLSPIGVFAHELGHAFGLPDLYDTDDGIDGKHSGAGNWDLMASGSYGCDGSTPETPCHMGAWSKEVLGWADIVTLAPDTDLGTMTLPPVETSGTIYRIEAGDGSGEYFLLENRQRIGYDVQLYAPGLLVWHIDPDWIAQYWGVNRVNAFAHRGVWLRQADGLDQLGQPNSGRGDPWDPFPYVQGGNQNRDFHAASEPAAVSRNGTAAGLTLTDITLAGTDVTFRVSTRFTRVTLRSTGDPGTGGLFSVDGTTYGSAAPTLLSAPFTERVITAANGANIAEGVRRPFVGWSDDPSAAATRVVQTPMADVQYVAEYGGEEVELAIEVQGGMNGVEPGTFSTQPSGPDLWFADGTTVLVQAVPTVGFGFTNWTGALAGQSNPAMITLSGPAQAGAVFVQTFAVPDATVAFPAAATQNVSLAAEEGSLPLTWTRTSGALPLGIAFESDGRLTGAALETGTFVVSVRASDARGLVDEGTLTLTVGAPEIDMTRLTQFFIGVGEPLVKPERDFLDRNGNQNGTYDLGDLRAYVLANPQLPFTAAARSLARIPGGGR